MAVPQQEDKDKISAKVLKQLSQTIYACSSLTQLSSRPGNFVYRGTLCQSFTNEDGAVATSIIVKHFIQDVNSHRDNPRNILRCKFEESMFNSVAEFSPSATGNALIRSPRVYLYDQESNIQIFEDFSNATMFKPMLFSANASVLFPGSSLATIGHNVGSWLRSFHNWAAAPEQAGLRDQILQDDPMRKLKYGLTYGGFLPVLENFPELLDGHMKTLETIQDTMAREFERPLTEQDEDWGLVHGDFWPGNILAPIEGWQDPLTSNESNKLFVIDWEFAQFGHRCYDIGQIVGDLYERKVYNKVDSTVPVMDGVIEGYGELSDDMAFRVAMHVGVHLINWYSRRPQRGPWVATPEAIVAGLTLGRDFILRGWEKDKKFFENSQVASLFTAL